MTLVIRGLAKGGFTSLHDVYLIIYVCIYSTHALNHDPMHQILLISYAPHIRSWLLLYLGNATSVFVCWACLWPSVGFVFPMLLGTKILAPKRFCPSCLSRYSTPVLKCEVEPPMPSGNWRSFPLVALAVVGLPPTSPPFHLDSHQHS